VCKNVQGLATSRTASWLTLLLILVASVASAEDHVIFKNGDRVSGKVKRVWDGDVTIEPSYDDDVQLKIGLEYVDHIESDREFDVTLEDDSKFRARPSGRGADGAQVLVVDGRESPLPLASIREIAEIEDYYDWESHIDVNVAFNKGNTDSLTTKIYADTNLKLGDHRHIANLTIARDEEDGVKTKDQNLFRYTYNWLFDEPWFLGGAFTAERDPVKELDYRFIVGTLVGRDLYDLPDRYLSVQVGPAYLVERRLDGTENSLAAFYALRFRQDLLRDDLELFHDHSLTTTLTGRSNTILKTATGFRFKITDLLYWNVSLDYDYETHPAGAAEHEDLSLVTGLGFEL